MQKIVVTGGAPLQGEVVISGAKNAVLPILCATLLADAPVEILNVPHLHDVVTTIKLLSDGKVAAEQFITGRIGLDGLVDRGFAELINNKEENVKILVSPQEALS